jgi:5'(3')-deoxyribonucleotidase
MHRLRVGIDLDGVVANFNRGWIERYNRDFGGSVSEHDVVEWDAPVNLTHFGAMGPFWDWARTCGEGRSIFRWLDTYPGAVESMTRLHDSGFEIVILTTKPDFAWDDTHTWLAENQVPSHEVHMLDDKTQVACDIYVDDAPHNVEALVAAHPAATVCRYVQPWNNPVEGAIDVADWAAVETTCFGVIAQR